MRKMIICGLEALILLLLCACTAIKPGATVNLLVQSPQGTPLAEVYVYAEQHPDGSDIFPGPLLGITDENGILEYSPEAYGAQTLTFLQYGFTVDGTERRKTEETVSYGVISVTVTREDVRNKHTVSVKVPSVQYTE